MEELEIDPEIQELIDNEVEDQLLYDPDPAPKKHGHKHGHKKSKSSHRGGRVKTIRKGNATLMVYDPAPRGKKHYRKKAKDFLSKYQDLVIPGTAGLTFYAAYTKRSKDLLASGAITKDSVIDAIMYDLKNLDATAAMDRLKAKAGSILLPGVVGIIAKAVAPKTKKAKPYVNLIGNVLLGFSIGTAGKTLLDPPIGGGSGPAPGGNRTIVVKEIGQTGSPAATVAGCPSCNWEV